MTDTPTLPLVLEAQGVSKRFGAVSALKNASLRVAHGEVVALMGANGAGKSTLVKILAGVQKPDSGTIRIAGKDFRAKSPAQSRASGVITVYQEPSLIPDLSMIDNLCLSDTPLEQFKHWIRELGLDGTRLDAMTGYLPLATLRILDLARALASSPKLLMLDEMTAALPNDLVAHVLRVVRRQADEGRAVIYISHRFKEITEICDRATVLRDGETVGDLKIEPGVEDHAVQLMLGAAAGGSSGRAETLVRRVAQPSLRVKGLKTGTRLSDVSLELYKGEVLGVVALEGQGQDELFDVLAGNLKVTAGTIEIEGKVISFTHPADAISAGITLVPGDRAKALLMHRSVHENIALPRLAQFARWGAISMGAEAAKVDAAIERLQIDTRAKGQVRRLSGGNQQKVTIARWIAQGVHTLLLFDPTRGIDIRTKRQIYELVRELAAQGAAILLYTSELAEVRQACDRCVVIFNGRVVDEVPASKADDRTLLRAAHGLQKEMASP